MNVTEFKSSLLHISPPANLNDLLKALWYDAKGDWDKAHEIAQEMETPLYCWIHAYLHRKEGDDWNAGYWYRKAKRPVPNYSLAEEWGKIVEELLS
ncbi:MAG: hypothetical protein MUE81_19585 [Thermoflexibacter sp.]|jgi:hypothetical protein|nr:hypothetical protein [Thermoflexibacter sp.]